MFGKCQRVLRSVFFIPVNVLGFTTVSLQEFSVTYGDLLYYCEVRWLSSGRMLERLYNLRKEVSAFLCSKGADFPEFNDPGWLCDLAFLTDITPHLNDLNVQLQGKDILVPDMADEVGLHTF